MEENSTKYQNILNTKWPEERLRRPKMSLQERAKIFLPFAALKGHEESLKNVAKNTEQLVLEQKL
mgnify:CR=1 FL=1